MCVCVCIHAFLVFSYFKKIYFYTTNHDGLHYDHNLNCFSALFTFPTMAYKALINCNGRMTTILEQPLGGERFILSTMEANVSTCNSYCAIDIFSISQY